MGFRMGRTFELSFEGTDLDGAEVRFRSASIGQLEEYLTYDGGVAGEAEIVAGFLISWNLEDENGEPLPATADGLLTLEEPAYKLILREWLKATRGVTAPLDRRSSDGSSSPEPGSVSIPMATL